MKTLTILFLIIISGCLQTSSDLQKINTEKRVVIVDYPDEATSIVNPITVSEESLSIGKAKYETFCSMCHGANGRGGGEATKRFEVDPSSLISDSVKMRSDGELFWATSNGVNDTKMLPWKDLLEDEEMWHIVNYIRTLQE